VTDRPFWTVARIADALRDECTGAEAVGLRGEDARIVAGYVESDDRARVAHGALDRVRECTHRRLRDQEHAQAIEPSRGAAQGFSFSYAGHGAGRESTDAPDRGQRRGSAHPVGCRPRVALERAKRGLRLGPEDAVFAAGVEAQHVQPAL